MQLESHYDVVFVGHNYLSTLGALMLKRAGKNVLIIREPKLKLSENYFYHFSLLEEGFLLAWNRHHGLGLDDYWETALKKESFLLGHKQAWMSLGNESPYLNLLELKRKVGNLLKLETSVSATVFDHDFFAYARDISTQWAEAPLLKNIEAVLDTVLCPDHLKESFNRAWDHYQSQVKSDNEVLHFHLLLQSILGTRVQFPIHKVQFSFALLHLLSPRRSYREESLPELEKRLKAQDVMVKEARIEGWQNKGGGGSLLLDSFEGLVHGKKIIVVGEFEANSPLSLKENAQGATLMTGLEFTFNLPTEDGPFILVDAENSEMGYTSVIKLVKNERGQWKGYDFVTLLEGDKASFYQKNLETRLQSLFHRYFPALTAPANIKITQGPEKKMVMIDFTRKEAIKENSLKKDGLLLLEEQAPGKKKEIPSVLYWGSLKSNSLGLFSLLLESRLKFIGPM